MAEWCGAWKVQPSANVPLHGKRYFLPVSRDELDGLIAEQISYYRARAHEYELGTLDLPGGEDWIPH